MREPGGNRSLRRRLGIGATLALGVGLTVAAAQSALVDATPATVSAAEDAEFGQTRVANEATRSSAQPLRSVDSTPAGVACGYPDNCDQTTDNGTGSQTDGGTGTETDEPTPALPASQNCTPTSVGRSNSAPYVFVNDSCSEARAALTANGCTPTESLGIGNDTYSTSSLDAIDAYESRGDQITGIYQSWNCGGDDSITLTTILPRSSM